MKIACTADWHIHPFKEFSKNNLYIYNTRRERYIEAPEGSVGSNIVKLNSRLVDSFNSIKAMRDICVKEGINEVIVAGDVFHKRGNLPTETLHIAHSIFKLFTDKGINLTVLSGNHDQDSNSDNPMDNLKALPEGGISSIRIVSQPTDIRLYDNTVLRCVPYRHNKEAIIEYFNKEVDDTSVATILVAHIGVSGAYIGEQVYANSDDFSLKELDNSKYSYIVLGHFHEPQILKKRTFYCGSPLQQNFGEEGSDHGFYIIDTETKADPEFRKLPYPEFVTVSDVDEATEKAKAGKFVRLKAKAHSVMIENVGNVKVELEREYTNKETELSLSDSPVDIIKKYNSIKGNKEYEKIGIEILIESLEE